MRRARQTVRAINQAAAERFSVNAATTAQAPQETVPTKLTWDELRTRWRAGDATRRALEYAFCAAQFVLILFAMELFHIETAPFRVLMVFCFGAYLVHRLLPADWQLPFFALASVLGTVLTLGVAQGGWSAALAFERGGWLLGIGCGLLLICHLPIPFWLRVTTATAAGIGLTILRAGRFSSPVPPAIWAILGSMFMFRLMIYLYDLKTSGIRPSVSKALSYGFMLPNVSFPLFPVVDYKTFVRSQDTQKRQETYQTGLAWMMRGVVQLLIYRAVYYHWHLDSSQVVNGTGVAVFILTNALLYLRVSGQFHVAIGLLHMFGFRLPETHRRYFLANSFTDYWRRVNIYWKDYIMKLVYYPLMFRFKRMNQTVAMVIATMIAFLATWFLHSYQVFWVVGRFPILPRDIVFWGTLALLVTVNAVWEAKRGRKRTLGARHVSWREHAVRALKTGGTFFVIAMLWSIWSSWSIGEWVDLISLTDATTVLLMGLAVLIVMGFSLVPESWWLMSGTTGFGSSASNTSGRLVRDAVLCCVLPACVVLALGIGAAKPVLGSQAQTFIDSLKSESKPAGSDDDNEARGYYEELMDVGLTQAAGEEALLKKPAGWQIIGESKAARPTRDMRIYELIPSATNVVNGVTYTTNRWGMRDREYSIEKPSDTLRIAILGDSHSMGDGAEQSAIFENVLEQRLNAERKPGQPKVELLNFSAGGYGSVSHMISAKARVFQFKPDIVLYITTNQERPFTIGRVVRAFMDGNLPKDSFPAQAVRKMRIHPKMSRRTAERRLMTEWESIVQWAYNDIVRQCAENGATAVWAYLPAAREVPSNPAFDQLSKLAKNAGMPVIDLRGAFGSAKVQDVIVAPWDGHPNSLGHQLIADRLYQELRHCSAIPQLQSSDVSDDRPRADASKD